MSSPRQEAALKSFIKNIFLEVLEISTWQPNRLYSYPLPKTLCGAKRKKKEGQEKIRRRGKKNKIFYND
jgi:hypothetical protein